MSQRYESMFDRLARAGEGAFVPFVTLGDPDPQLSLEIIDNLIASGADALELGIPFSDPLADGPTIQGATIRALDSGTTPSICFDMLASIRRRHPDIPLGLLLYANLVFAAGVEQFYQKCAAAGVDSVLIADLPVEMCDIVVQAAADSAVASIYVAPPNSDQATIEQIAARSSGYTYLLSRAGVTGADREAGAPLQTLIEQLKYSDAPPALLGFGISRPEQVKAALSAGAAGAISGSAVVGIIERCFKNPIELASEISAFVTEMKAATRQVAI